MSLVRRLLNPYLRLTEKRRLARAAPDAVRRAFERNAKLFFHAPRGTVYGSSPLRHDGQSLDAVSVNAEQKGPLLLYFHGGGYIFGSPHTHKAMLARLSDLTGLPALLPRYRLAPEHPFPAQIEDALSAYRAVMDRPGGVILGGDSAGGGLALGLLGEITRLGLPHPLGTFAFAPLTDLSFSAPSIAENAETDVILPAARAAEFSGMVLQGADPADPRISPLHAEFGGAGPVWIAASDTEILIDDSRNMAVKLRAQGVEVTLIIEPGLPHVWPIFQTILPEARATLAQLAGWISALPPCPADS